MKTEEPPVGRELDEFIAEKAMEWEVVPASKLDERCEGRQWTPCVSWIEHKNGLVAFRTRESLIGEWVTWSPSLDIAAAWEVVEKEFFSFPIHKIGGEYVVDMGVGDRVKASTAPHAICLAVYKDLKVHE